MAKIKVTRKTNNINKEETPSEKIKVSYNSSYLLKVQDSLSKNADLLNEYITRKSNNEYMTASELADYEEARKDYVSSAQKLNTMSGAKPIEYQPYESPLSATDYAGVFNRYNLPSANRNIMRSGDVSVGLDFKDNFYKSTGLGKVGGDWIADLGTDIKNSVDYYSAFKNADEHKKFVYSNKPYSEIASEIEKLKEANTPEAEEEIAWLTDFAENNPNVIMSMTKDEYDSMLGGYDERIDSNKKQSSAASDRYAYLTKLLTENKAKLERGHKVEGMTMSEIQAERKRLETEAKETGNLADQLSAKKTQTERNYGVYKNWYVPETKEFNEGGYKRNYTNPTPQQLDEGYGAYEKALQDIAYPRGGSVGEDGSVYDAEGNVLYDASKYDVEDKLGLYLSTSKEDIDEALTTLAGPAGGNSTYARLLQEGVTGSWNELTDYEIKLYYYLYSSQGKDAAYQFLNDITTELNRREMEKEEKAMAEMNFWGLAWENVKSVPKNVLGGAIGFADDVNRMARGEELNPYSRAHSWQNDALVSRQEMANDIDNATGNIKIPWINYGAGDAYQALMSGADSLAGAHLLGGNGYGVLMGMGAASSTAKDLYERGASNDQIMAGALLAGAAEMIFEQLSIEHLVEMKSSAGKKLIINMLKQGGVEASEEVLTELANAISDYAIMGGASKYDNPQDAAKDIVKAGLSGFISGLASSGVTGTKNNIVVNGDNRKKYGDKPVALVDEALKHDPKNEFAQKLKKKLDQGKSLTGTEVTLLVEMNTEAEMTADRAKLGDAVKDRLTALGETSNINTLSEVIVDSVVEGQTTKPFLINRSDFGAQVLDELMGRGVSTDTEWNARLGTNLVNPERYNRGYIKDLEGAVREYNKKASALPESNSYTETDNGITYKGMTKEGTEVEVKGIDIVTGEIVTDKGNYAAEDIALTDNATARLVDNATKYNRYNVADLYIAAYDPKRVSVSKYNSAFDGIYTAAKAGESFEAAWNRYNVYDAFNETEAKYIWQAGNDEYTVDQNRRDAKLSGDTTVAKTPTKKAKSNGEVRFRNGVTADTAEQKNVVKLAKQISNIIGIDIEFFDSRVDKNVNGWFDRETDTIHLDMQKAINDRHTIAYTLSHELMHYIEKWSPQKYDTFAKFLLEKYAEKGMDLNAMLVRKQLELEANNGGKRVSVDEAYSELIADSCEAFLLDSNATEVLAELAAQDRDLVARIKRFFADILNKLRKAYKGLNPQSIEGQMVRKMAAECEQIHRMFEEALADAVQNYQSAEVVEGVSKMENTTAKVEAAIKPSDSMVQRQRKLAQLDKDYKNAVKQGDMETAQRMVDEAAKRAGYTQKVLHGTDRFGFTKLDVSKSDDGISFFATDTVETAGTYTARATVRSLNSKTKSTKKEGFAESKVRVTEALNEAVEEYSNILGDDWKKTNAAILAKDLSKFEKESESTIKNLEQFISFEHAAQEVYRRYRSAALLTIYNEATNETDEETEAKISSINKKFNAAVYAEERSHTQKRRFTGIYDLYANTDGHLIIDGKGSRWNEIESDVLPDAKAWSTREVAKYAKENGYSGVTFKNVVDSGNGASVAPATIYVFFDPQSQVKSADTVTYDKLGRVIPLSKRFNEDNSDIRYQRKNTEVQTDPTIVPTNGIVQYNRKAVNKHKADLEKYYTKGAAVDLNTLNERYDELLKIWDEIGGELNSEFLKQWDNKGQDHAFTVFKAQAGYKYNIELSSMCKKGVPLFEAIDRIVKSEVMSKLKSDTIGKAEKEILYDILKQHHFEIPCAICYVEQARQREGTIINAFLNGNEEGKLGWNEVLSKLEAKMKEMGVDYTFPTVSRDISTDKYSAADLSMDEKTQNAFYKALMSLCNEEIDRYNKETKDNKLKRKIRPTLEGTTPADVKKSLSGTLPANLTLFKVLFNESSSRFAIDRDLLYSSMTTLNLAKRHKALYSLFNSQGGTAGYKTKQTPIVYVGDMLKKKWAASTAREAGGIRNQSNSDFQMYTLLDQAQMYMDFTAKGQYLQAYTKVLAELKLFGLSRGKINASLIPAVHVYKDSNGNIDVAKTMENAGLDENGNPIFDDVEGIPHEEAFMLIADENYSKSIGGICIGYSYNHIDKLLDDPRVQLIIGFHDKTNDPDKRYRGARYAHNFNGENEAKGVDDKGKYGTIHIGFNQFVIRAEKMFKSGKNDTFTGTATFNGKQYSPNDIPKLAADLYLDHCEQNDYTPAYERFSAHENYYKLLADFSLYDSKGNYAPHRKVAYEMPTQVPYLDKNGAKKYMDTKAYIKAELKGEMAIRDDLSVALADESADGIIPQFIKKANELYDEMNDVQYQGKKKGGNNFVEDKYFARQIDRFETLKSGGYITVGEITKGSPLNKIGILEGKLYFDVSKILKEMRDRNDVIPPEKMKDIPSVLDNPIVITEYVDNAGVHSANVYGNLYIGSSPLVVGVMIAETPRGTVVNKVQTVHPNRNVMKEMTDDNILYLSENKKETKSWFQALGAQMPPLGGNKSGFIRSISHPDDSVNTEDNQYQQKLPSDRKILADALESVSMTNEKDADIIRRYKAQMDTITKAETRLAEVNAEIKELSFAKGKRDTNRLALLHNEKTALTKKVNDFDKRLLRMESTEVLKNVLDREKAKVRAAANAKAKERVNEVRQQERDKAAEREANLKAKANEKLSAAKEKAEEREAAIREKFREAQEKGRENRNKRQLIEKITNRIDKLSKLLNKPTKESHIKKGLRGTVGEAVALGNLIFSDYADNADIARYGVESVSDEEATLLKEYRELLLERDGFPKLDKDSPEYEEYAKRRRQISSRISQLNKKLESVFDRERRRLNNVNVSTVIDSLAKEYERLKDSDDSYIRAAYDSEYAQVLRDLSTDLGEVVKGDLTVAQLEAIANAYSAVAHTVATANKVFRNGKTESLGELVTAVQEEIGRFYKEGKDLPAAIDRIRDFTNKYSWNELKPAMAFERLGSEAFKSLFMDAVMADGVWGREINLAKNHIDKCRKQYGASKWKLDAAKTYTVGGRTFRVSIGEMMSIYALSKRDQAGDHITVGGFVHGVDSKYMSEKGFLRWEQKYTEKTKPYPVTQAELADMLKTVKNGKIGLTQEMKNYVDAMQAYFKILAEKGNEISNTLFGIDLFAEEHYFPIQSVKDYISSVKTAFSGVDTHVSLKNTGVTKPTTPRANNPIVLRNFDTVWAEHCDTMAKYYAYVLPIENLQRVFNTTPTAYEDSETSATKALITRTFGSNATNYFETYLNDLNGGTKTYKNAFFNFFGKWKKARVAMSMSTAIQQPFAIVRAMDMIDMKYFGMQPDGARVAITNLYEELTKYAPIAITKEIGGYDIGSSSSSVDYIDHKFGIDDVTMYLPGKADQIGWSIIWQAVKNEVAHTSGLDVGSEAYYARCGERFTEVIAHTQVYDSVNSRSGFMRSKSDLDKFATSFMGEPTTIINMLYSSMLKVSRADGRAARAKALGAMAKTYAVVLLSNALTKAAAALIYAGRDEDEDEGYWEKWVQAFGKNFLSELNPFASLPYFRDIVSALEGWDVERPDMAVFIDAIESYQKLAKAMKNGEMTFDDAMKFIGNVGDGFGVPITNTWRDLKGIYNTIGTMFDGVGSEDFFSDMWGSMKEALPLGEEKNTETKFIDLYDKGKTKEAQTYLSDIIADKAKEKAEKDGYEGDSKYYLKKYEDEAKSDIRSDFTKELKPLYLEALKAKDNATTKRIRKIMAATQLYDNIDETFIEWRRAEVSGDFKDRYLDAYERKDYKAMEKVIKEMAATGLWKKPLTTVQTWIRNYNEGA